MPVLFIFFILQCICYFSLVILANRYTKLSWLCSRTNVLLLLSQSTANQIEGKQRKKTLWTFSFFLSLSLGTPKMDFDYARKFIGWQFGVSVNLSYISIWSNCLFRVACSVHNENLNKCYQYIGVLCLLLTLFSPFCLLGATSQNPRTNNFEN